MQFDRFQILGLKLLISRSGAARISENVNYPCLSEKRHAFYSQVLVLSRGTEGNKEGKGRAWY